MAAPQTVRYNFGRSMTPRRRPGPTKGAPERKPTTTWPTFIRTPYGQKIRTARQAGQVMPLSVGSPRVVRYVVWGDQWWPLRTGGVAAVVVSGGVLWIKLDGLGVVGDRAVVVLFRVVGVAAV